MAKYDGEWLQQGGAKAQVLFHHDGEYQVIYQSRVLYFSPKRMGQWLKKFWFVKEVHNGN